MERAPGMTPYYQDADVTLYHGDCRQVLPLLDPLRTQGETPALSRVDCVLTDPPYGIAKGSAFVRNGGETVAECGEEGFNALVDEAQWVPDAIRLLRSGGYFATFCDTRRIRETEDAISGWYGSLDAMTVWRRFYLINQAPPPTPRPTFMSGVQECVIAFKGTREWYGGGATPNFWIGMPATRGAQNEHPAEKPLEAMVLLVNALCRPGGIVLDPFAGSGTTLKAAQITGRKAIGIEVEEAHCESIARRLSQSVRSPQNQMVIF
jgi:site-specific DNA-methyltransferase (adenine-specific)